MTTIKEAAGHLASLLNKERDKEKAAEKKPLSIKYQYSRNAMAQQQLISEIWSIMRSEKQISVMKIIGMQTAIQYQSTIIGRAIAFLTMAEAMKDIKTGLLSL